MATAKEKDLEEKLHKIVTSLGPTYALVCGNLGSYDKFYTAPGGIQHHGRPGGLLEHTLEVVQYCEGFLKIKPEAKREILIAAALWHDLGKIWEYYFDDFGEVRKTDKAVKLHHTYTSITEFSYHAKGKLNQSQIDQVNHVIASHHYYTPERNHPILPQTLEALLLCNADHLSAMFGETK